MLASSEACQQTLHSLTRSHCKLKETNPRARSWSHHVFFVLSLGTLICAPSRERRKHVSDHLIVSTGFMAGGTFLLAGIIKMPSYGQQWIRSLEPAIFPEVINLGWADHYAAAAASLGQPRDLWKGIHLPQTSHFLSSRFLIHFLFKRKWESWRKCPVEDWMLLGRLVPQQ